MFNLTGLPFWAKPLGITFGWFLFFKTVLGVSYIPSGSMQPTLDPGDIVFSNNVAYGLTLPGTPARFASWDEPARGDVVIFQAPARADRDQKLYIKRVIGVAGDTLEIRHNRIALNGLEVPLSSMHSQLLEHLGRPHPILGDGSTPAEPLRYRVPPGHVFVMGDHRSSSYDSRDWGPLPVDRIRGKAMVVGISLDTSCWKGGSRL